MVKIPILWMGTQDHAAIDKKKTRAHSIMTYSSDRQWEACISTPACLSKLWYSTIFLLLSLACICAGEIPLIVNALIDHISITLQCPHSEFYTKVSPHGPLSD
ncbi:hypothetical protein E2C01_051988 [Portunus trituberculatus]|uniref:Uncharacterized protein n=1 Tax=Portunus trituberculatus TaxID=210409 RepID=A0A5B7GKC5_PORTR|nr:hypothetical protein [Portunus trituberculatus]